MNTKLYVAFVVATIVLILIPGPTVLAVTSASLRRGTRAGLVAVAGSASAAAIQLVAVIAGVFSLLSVAGRSFEWIRWIGAAYLVYLGIRTWFDGHSQRSTTASLAAITGMHDFLRGFLVTLTNPKTLLFLGAFLPQFVDRTLPELPQLIVLAVTFLGISTTLDSGWALLGASAGRLLVTARASRLVNLISGAFLIAAGTALALVRGAQ